jgi:ATP-binding cassette subfamily F protein 3
MLSLEHIGVQFGGRTLFDDLSITIGTHDRIGLVGVNGSGKSTLLKIIAGLNSSDTGFINKSNFVTVGYLPQDGISAKGKTLFHEAETAFEDILLVREELKDAQHSLDTLDTASPEYMETVEIFGELHHKLEELDAYRMKSKIEQVLTGLGFSEEDMRRQTDEFSGGWQMRIALTKLLLQEPNVLLLDEPTNHLDLESLQWLEDYLQNYNGAIVLVSHDRAFLDGLTTKTIALSGGSFDVYNGNFSFFEKEQVVRKELLVNQYRNQQQHIKQTQEFIERFRYKATKARQVQSRIKQLEKMDTVELESEEDEIHFHFPKPVQSGRVVMELLSVVKSYGSHCVIQGLNYKIERGDRVAVVGVNGAGKSTLARILAGVEPFDSGDRMPGYNVMISYFAQDQADELDLSLDALTTVESTSAAETRVQLRTLLGSFLFHGDDVFKKVGVLSGGEKSRLALAKMLLKPANFLIMDEPTNHLDMRSKRVLQDALIAYNGTFFIVSHDRSFLDPLVNKVLELSPGSIRTYLGNVSEYLAKKKSERKPERKPEQQAAAAEPPEERKKNRQEEQEKKKAAAKETRTLKRAVEQAEAEIQRLEARKAEIEKILAEPEFYKRGSDVSAITDEYALLRKKIEEAYRIWNRATERLASVIS